MPIITRYLGGPRLDNEVDPASGKNFMCVIRTYLITININRFLYQFKQ